MRLVCDQRTAFVKAIRMNLNVNLQVQGGGLKIPHSLHFSAKVSIGELLVMGAALETRGF